jgi:hypothetical protein
VKLHSTHSCECFVEKHECSLMSTSYTQKREKQEEEIWVTAQGVWWKKSFDSVSFFVMKPYTKFLYSKKKKISELSLALSRKIETQHHHLRHFILDLRWKERCNPFSSCNLFMFLDLHLMSSVHVTLRITR